MQDIQTLIQDAKASKNAQKIPKFRISPTNLNCDIKKTDIFLDIYTKKSQQKTKRLLLAHEDLDYKCKNKKNKISKKKFFGKAAQISRSRFGGGGGGIYPYPYNPKSKPQNANSEISHTLTRYLTRYGQNALNIADITHKRTNKPIYNPLQQHKRGSSCKMNIKRKYNPFQQQKRTTITIYLYSIVITLLHYKKHYYKVHKYILLKKSLIFFVKSIAYQKYFISLHLKRISICFKVLFIYCFIQNTLKQCLYLFVLSLVFCLLFQVFQKSSMI